MSRIGNLSSRIFVGGLNPNVDEVDLEKAFRLFGEIVNVMVMRDRENGRSRGFAFISFKDEQASEEAISRMHGVEIKGKCVSVRHAERERYLDDKQPAGGGRGRSFGGHSSGFPSNINRTFSHNRDDRPSNIVFVTEDADRSDEQDDRFSGRTRNSPDHVSKYSEERGYNAGPSRNFHQSKDEFVSRNDDLQGDRGYYQEQRGYGNEEMSPTRELNAYIKSRGRSYSPVRQLTRKITTEQSIRGGNDEELYESSPPSKLMDLQSNQAYGGRSERSGRGEGRGAPEYSGRRDSRETRKYGNREYRSRSPVEHKARDDSPGNVRMDNRERRDYQRTDRGYQGRAGGNRPAQQKDFTSMRGRGNNRDTRTDYGSNRGDFNTNRDTRTDFGNNRGGSFNRDSGDRNYRTKSPDVSVDRSDWNRDSRRDNRTRYEGNQFNKRQKFDGSDREESKFGTNKSYQARFDGGNRNQQRFNNTNSRSGQRDWNNRSDNRNQRGNHHGTSYQRNTQGARSRDDWKESNVQRNRKFSPQRNRNFDSQSNETKKPFYGNRDLTRQNFRSRSPQMDNKGKDDWRQKSRYNRDFDTGGDARTRSPPPRRDNRSFDSSNRQFRSR